MGNPLSRRATRCAVKRNRLFLTLLVILTVFSSIGLSAMDALATEGGGGAYPNGAEDFMSGAVPPPGFYFLNYFTYYTADKLKIKDAPDIPDFDLDVIADTLRFLYVSKQQILGGYWGMHVFVPFANVDVTLPGRNQSNFGLGDIIVDPFILSWHTKNWHFVTAVDVYVPTGSYDEEDIANVGRNYWTFEPIFAFTYLSDGGFEVSSKIMYDFNTKNHDTAYLSGQEFHFDYTVGYKIQNWSLGVGGYYYKQVTNDKVNGGKVPVGDGFKGQVFALGPQIKYDYKNMSFILKYQIEMAVENKPEGDKLWFKFVYAF